MKQVIDILLRPRPDAPAPERNGQLPEATYEVREVPGPLSLEKELTDLENVKRALGRGLDEQSYEQAKKKIREKYGGQS